eukprot:1687521-Prymnesium_polylepis.1
MPEHSPRTRSYGPDGSPRRAARMSAAVTEVEVRAPEGAAEAPTEAGGTGTKAPGEVAEAERRRRSVLELIPALALSRGLLARPRPLGASAAAVGALPTPAGRHAALAQLEARDDAMEGRVDLVGATVRAVAPALLGCAALRRLGDQPRLADRHRVDLQVLQLRVERGVAVGDTRARALPPVALQPQLAESRRGGRSTVPELPELYGDLGRREFTERRRQAGHVGRSRSAGRPRRCRVRQPWRRKCQGHTLLPLGRDDRQRLFTPSHGEVLVDDRLLRPLRHRVRRVDDQHRRKRRGRVAR